MAQAKSFTDTNGKRIAVDPRTPLADIRWLVMRYHVSMSHDEVAADIAKRAAGWPEKCKRQAIAYALKCHEDNRAVYRSVA